MGILLNVVAIFFGIAAFVLGPEAPVRMLSFGLAALVLFGLGISQMDGDTVQEDCDRYSWFASDC